MKNGYPAHHLGILAFLIPTLLSFACAQSPGSGPLTGSGIEGAVRGASGVALEPTEIVLLNDLDNGEGVKGRDGTFSFVFGGELVFPFGDTLLSRPNAEGTTWVTNTMYRTTDFDADDGPGPGGIAGGYNYLEPSEPPIQWIPWTPAEVAFNDAHSTASVAIWPGPTFRDPITSRQYLFVIKVIAVPGAGWYGGGTGLARVNSLDEPAERILSRPGEAEEFLLFPKDTGEGAFGQMAVAHGDHVYAYWCNGDDWGRTRVARAPFADEAFLRRDAWRFWNGTNWVEEIGEAAVIMNTAGGSIHWNHVLGSYLLVSMGFLSDQVRLRVAQQPEGPWSPEVVAFTAERATDNAIPYLGIAQQPLQKGEGRYEYVTYCIPGANWTGGRMPLVRMRFGPEPPNRSEDSTWTRY